MSLQVKLLEWFEKNQRPLPWRKEYRPYDVWISEIMLQQTQMNTVLPYYERWLKLFPDLETLAKSDLKKVLKAWEGLGYYSRARNLHESAQLILKKYEGIFPDDFDAIHDVEMVNHVLIFGSVNQVDVFVDICIFATRKVLLYLALALAKNL